MQRLRTVDVVVGVVVAAVLFTALIPGAGSSIAQLRPARKAKARYHRWRRRRDRREMARPVPEYEPLHRRRPVRRRLRRMTRQLRHPSRTVRHWWRRRPYRAR